ncbi:MAG: DUF4143 domain-containing protein [Candidatus Jacksonbacteria bacterium]
METINRFFTNPKQSFFLFGPRGTGKSTWTKLQFPTALRLDLLQPDIFRTYSAHPEQFRELVLGNPQKRTIIIDEVQKIPELLDVVHSLIEEKSDLQFVLTGSSARKLKRTGVDLLAGRAVLRTLHPFMAAELGTVFNLEKSLQIGALPLVLAAKNPPDVLQTYAALYLKEEVQMEGLVRNIGNFARFLEAVSFSHASVLNISNVARECEIERKIIENYISIAEDLLLAYRVPVFAKRTKRKIISHPKFYFFDAGVFRSLRPVGPLDRVQEIDGAALEGLVAQHLRAWLAYTEQKNQLYFWRTHSGAEVDFIIYGAENFMAIEIKNSNKIRVEDLRGLRLFKNEYPKSQTLLLYRGNERLKKGDIWCVPCAEFLANLKPGQTIDVLLK